MLICMLNNVLDMSRNVLRTISGCRCVLFVWALCVSWFDSTWTPRDKEEFEMTFRKNYIQTEE
jgi:hypothetical protein